MNVEGLIFKDYKVAGADAVETLPSCIEGTIVSIEENRIFLIKKIYPEVFINPEFKYSIEDSLFILTISELSSKETSFLKEVETENKINNLLKKGEIGVFYNMYMKKYALLFKIIDNIYIYKFINYPDKNIMEKNIYVCSSDMISDSIFIETFEHGKDNLVFLLEKYFIKKIISKQDSFFNSASFINPIIDSLTKFYSYQIFYEEKAKINQIFYSPEFSNLGIKKLFEQNLIKYDENCNLLKINERENWEEDFYTIIRDNSFTQKEFFGGNLYVPNPFISAVAFRQNRLLTVKVFEYLEDNEKDNIKNIPFLYKRTSKIDFILIEDFKFYYYDLIDLIYMEFPLIVNDFLKRFSSEEIKEKIIRIIKNNNLTNFDKEKRVLTFIFEISILFEYLS